MFADFLFSETVDVFQILMIGSPECCMRPRSCIVERRRRVSFFKGFKILLTHCIVLTMQMTGGGGFLYNSIVWCE